MIFCDKDKTYKEIETFDRTIRVTQADPSYNKYKESINDTDEGVFRCNTIQSALSITVHNDVLYVDECKKRGGIYTPMTRVLSKPCLVDNYYLAENSKSILEDLGDFSPMNVLNVANKLATIECDERSNYKPEFDN